MVWGGNRYVEVFRRRGGGKPKKGPPNGEKTADRPPHGKKKFPIREKCSKKQNELLLSLCMSKLDWLTLHLKFGSVYI